MSVQAQIEKTLRPYFERNITATLSSIKTGINIKTVCKYFKFWVEQIRESEERDFLERQRIERERTILSYDNLILEEYELLDEIKDEIKKYKKEKKPISRYLLSTQIEILRNVSSFVEKKGLFSLKFSMEEILGKRVEELEKKVFS